MSVAFLQFLANRYIALIAGLFAITLTAGCTTSTVAPTPIESEPDIEVPPIPPDWIPVARYGRYTLMELTPQAAQQNLLFQVVDVTLPANLHATVGDAIRHVLLRSGFSLCNGNAAVTALNTLPLPAAHGQLGPLSLYDALLTLAGPAWELRVEDAARQVCFERADTSNSLPPATRPSIENTSVVSEPTGDQP